MFKKIKKFLIGAAIVLVSWLISWLIGGLIEKWLPHSISPVSLWQGVVGLAAFFVALLLLMIIFNLILSFYLATKFADQIDS